MRRSEPSFADVAMLLDPGARSPHGRGSHRAGRTRVRRSARGHRDGGLFAPSAFAVGGACPHEDEAAPVGPVGGVGGLSWRPAGSTGPRVGWIENSPIPSVSRSYAMRPFAAGEGRFGDRGKARRASSRTASPSGRTACGARPGLDAARPRPPVTWDVTFAPREPTRGRGGWRLLTGPRRGLCRRPNGWSAASRPSRRRPSCRSPSCRRARW